MLGRGPKIYKNKFAMKLVHLILNIYIFNKLLLFFNKNFSYLVTLTCAILHILNKHK